MFYPGKDYFDLQPSWFDTLSKNTGCLQVENVPLKAKDLEAMKNVKSNSKAFTKPAKGMKKETCKIWFYTSDGPHLCEVVYSESDKAVKPVRIVNIPLSFSTFAMYPPDSNSISNLLRCSIIQNHKITKLHHTEPISLVLRWTSLPRKLKALQNEHTSPLPTLLKLKLWWLLLH